MCGKRCAFLECSPQSLGSSPEHGERRHCRRPRWSLRVGLAAACVCAADVASVLPHPVVVAPPGAAPPVAFAAFLAEPRGASPTALLQEAELVAVPARLPSHEVRRHYHERLRAWSERLQDYRANMTSAGLASGSPASAGNASELSSATLRAASPLAAPVGLTACALAAASVRERESARVEARLLGSAGLHAALVLRDLWVYGSLDPFSFDRMHQQRRKKLAAEGNRTVSDEDVCLALVDSSTRTSKAFDALAENRRSEGASYEWETAHLYFWPCLVLVSCVYAVEAFVQWLPKPSTKCARD